MLVMSKHLSPPSLVAQRVKRLAAVWETQVQFLVWEDPLEKAMATHSSTLAWKIPWTEEPGRLQSMGSLRVRHDWATSLSLFLSCTGEGNGNPLQCSCLENPRDGGAWWATYSPWGLKESDTTERTHSHFNQLWEGTLDSINDIWDLSAAYTEVFVYLK